MATIITVHGTYANGSEHGDQWWQTGSAFEREMRALVEGADGRLDVCPHIWDGLNSETSRRAAGVALAQRLDELDRRGERYCLVGHSHGGSVIASALIRSAHKYAPRTGLARWLTVGTPFVGFARKRFLFTRLGVLGRAGYVSLLTYVLLIALVFSVTELRSDPAGYLAIVGMLAVLFMLAYIVLGWDSDRRLEQSGAVLPFKRQRMRFMPRLGLAGRIIYLLLVAWLVIATSFPILNGKLKAAGDWYFLPVFVGLVGVMPLAIFHLLARTVPARLARIIGNERPRRRDLVAAWAGRWCAFRHPDDEAIEGLRRLPEVTFPIFGEDIAVAPLTFISVMALPLLIALAILSPDISNWLHDQVNAQGFSDGKLFGARPFGGGHDITSNVMLICVMPIALMIWIMPAADQPMLHFLGMLVLSPLIFFAVSVLLLLVVRLVATALSRILSAFLDRLAWRQIRASAYGSDTQGEVAHVAGDAPAFAQGCLPLPMTLAQEISRVADEAASSAIPKLRQSLNRLAFAEDGRARSDLVSDYLTWDELIHTAYFKVPLFVKLVAYAIAHSDGFRPSQRFLADPDYARVASLYAQMQPEANPLPGPR